MTIRCKKEDADIIKGLLSDCSKEFNKFLNSELKREKQIEMQLEVSDNYLEKGESE